MVKILNLNKEKINLACNKIYFAMAKSKADPNAADIYFYNDIQADGMNFFGKEIKSDTSANCLKNKLDELGDISQLNIHINSKGGSVFEGIAIYSQLKQHNAHKTVYVDGIAASIASVIAMAGDEVIISDTAMMMIHPAWTIVMGNAEELRKEADVLDKMTESIKQAYLSKSDKISEEKMNDLISSETWLNAKECVKYGFADRLFENSVGKTEEKPEEPEPPKEPEKSEDFAEKALGIIGKFFM